MSTSNDIMIYIYNFFQNPIFNCQSDYTKFLLFLYNFFTGNYSNIKDYNISNIEKLTKEDLLKLLPVDDIKDNQNGIIYPNNYILELLKYCSNEKILSIVLVYLAKKDNKIFCDAENYFILRPEFLYIIESNKKYDNELCRLVSFFESIDSIIQEDIGIDKYQNDVYQLIMGSNNTVFSTIEEDSNIIYQGIKETFSNIFPSDHDLRFYVMLKWYHPNLSIRYKTNFSELKMALQIFNYLGLDDKIDEILTICYIYNFPNASIYEISQDLLIRAFEIDMYTNMWNYLKIFILNRCDDLLSRFLNNDIIEQLNQYLRNDDVVNRFEIETNLNISNFIVDLISRRKFREAFEIQRIFYLKPFDMDILSTYIDKYYIYSSNEDVVFLSEPIIFIISNFVSISPYDIILNLFIECSSGIIERVIDYFRYNNFNFNFELLNCMVIPYALNSKDKGLFIWLMSHYTNKSLYTNSWLIENIGNALVELYNDLYRYNKYYNNLAKNLFKFVIEQIPFFSADILNMVSNVIPNNWPPAKDFYLHYEIYNNLSDEEMDF